MSELPGRWRGMTEIIGTIAVVVSLIYVGFQVKQNTAAIQTATTQGVNEQHAATIRLIIESPEFADLLVRANRSADSLSVADSLRYDWFLNQRVNVYETVYTSAIAGTMEEGMAAGWLAGIPGWLCLAGALEHWRENAGNYHPGFQVAMDSVIASTDCSVHRAQ